MGLRKTHHQPWFYNSKYDLNTRLEEEEFVAPCDGYLRHWQDLVLHQAWCWSSMAGSKHHLIQSPTQIQWKHITWNISIIRWVNSSNILVITVWTCSRFPTSLPTSSLVMAWSTSVLTVTLALVPSPGQPLLTCPGFPGYCSESFPGQSCNVVCDFGRNNVPLCQVGTIHTGDEANKGGSL